MKLTSVRRGVEGGSAL